MTLIATPDGTYLATIPGHGTISAGSLAEIDAEKRRLGVHHHSHSRAVPSPGRREQPGGAASPCPASPGASSTRPPLLSAADGQRGKPIPEAGGAKMDGGANRHPGRAGVAPGITRTNSGSAVTNLELVA